jgi:anaerobic selenocysteine-containing dehydrogenase
MTAFADLILPDTTYLERHDVMSMLDRPISEFDGPVDSVRIPVVPPTGDCKPFQEVLIELGTRLKLPAFVTKEARASSATTRTSSSTGKPSRAPASASSPAGAARAARSRCAASRIPNQWEMYKKNNCVFHYELPKSYQYMRNWNKGYLEWSQRNRITRYAEPILIHLYSEVLQTLPPAAQGKGFSRKPPEHLKKRVETYFDPLPFYYDPLEAQAPTSTSTRWRR